MGGASKWMKDRQPGSIWSLHGFLNPFQNRRIWTFYPIMHFLNSRVYHGGSWCLSNYHIQRLEKINLFKMLDFQRIHFSKKGLGNVPPLLLNQIVKINLLSQIIKFQVNVPFEDFLTVITNFFGSLRSKRGWLFWNNKSSFENIFVSGTEEASIW